MCAFARRRVHTSSFELDVASTALRRFSAYSFFFCANRELNSRMRWLPTFLLIVLAVFARTSADRVLVLGETAGVKDTHSTFLNSIKGKHSFLIFSDF